MRHPLRTIALLALAPVALAIFTGCGVTIHSPAKEQS